MVDAFSRSQLFSGWNNLTYQLHKQATTGGWNNNLQKREREEKNEENKEWEKIEEAKGSKYTI